MAEKTLNSRVIHKHDTEVNWSNTTNFIPKIGEIIVYDPDEKISVRVVKISFEEYEVLANKFSIQEKENANLRDRLTHVEDQLATTNSLLEKLLEKLG